MAYQHHVNTHHRFKRAKRVRLVAVFASIITIVSVGIVGSDWLIAKLNANDTYVSKENVTSVQSANVSVYRSEYFQFQAPDSWVAVAAQSSEKKFVYVKNKGALVTQRLVVYIDRPLTDTERDVAITNVLPVEVTEAGGFANIGEVSAQCRDGWPDEEVKGNPMRITFEKVSFVCNPGSQEYNVVVGEYDGDELIEATLDDGRKVGITIVFSDLTAYPGPGDLYNIITSFSIL